MTMIPQKFESEITELRGAIEAWRKMPKRPVAMPEELWIAAARLASQLGVGVTARALKIDYCRLKDRIGRKSLPAKTPGLRQVQKEALASPTFVRMSLDNLGQSSSPTSMSCQIEIETFECAKMRAQINNVSAIDLAIIFREFVR